MKKEEKNSTIKLAASKMKNENNTLHKEVEIFLEKQKSIHDYPKRLFINNIQRTVIINLSNLMYLKSIDQQYTLFKTNNLEKHISSNGLKTYATILQNHPHFVRVHKAHIINKNFVKEIQRKSNRIVLLMADGQELKTTSKSRNEICELLVH
jgi:DNA-binding LytR/AlgR family response regulator